MTEKDIKDTSELVVNSADLTTTQTKSPLSVPASIILAGVIIAVAIMITGYSSGSSAQPTVANTNNGAEALPQQRSAQDKITAAAKTAGLNGEDVFACATSAEYSERVENDIQNAVATGGQGTPWTVVVDTQTGNRYPLGGAFPTDQVVSLLESEFANYTIEDSQAAALDQLTEVSNEDYFRGPADARYVFVEYSDFDCPFCSRFHETMKTLLDTRDDVAWVYRDFPLEQLHPDARLVANAAECAGEGGSDPDGFWSFADAYFLQS